MNISHSLRRYVLLLSVAPMFMMIMLLTSAQGVLAVEDAAAMISVEYIGVNPALESIDAGTPFLFGDVETSLSASRLGGDPSFENAFLLRPTQPLLLEFFAVDGFSPEGKLLPGEVLERQALRKGEVYLFRHHVPEGMPNLLVCGHDGVARRCWTPRFSGMDEAVKLDPGFVLFKGK